MKIYKIFNEKIIMRWGVLAGIFYFFLYLYSIGDISPESSSEKIDFFILNTWKKQILKSKGVFIWEGIGAFSLGDLYMILSPLNITLGTVLSILVALNVVIALYGRKYPGSCPLNANKGILGIFTGLLGGFACCVPTFIIILGPAFSGLTIFFIRLRIFLIPLTFIILLWGALWGLRRIN